MQQQTRVSKVYGGIWDILSFLSFFTFSFRILPNYKQLGS